MKNVVTEADFDTDVLKSSIPVLVDFWAEWCGPCVMLAPVLKEIATEMADHLKVVKINVDESQELANRFAIRSIPTLIIFNGGNVIATKTGMMTKTQLTSWVKSVL